MKRKIICIFILSVLLLCSCHSTGDEKIPEKSAVPVENEHMEDYSTAPTSPDHEQNKDLIYIPKKIPVNTTQETVSLEWNGERLSKALACREDILYFCQWEREGRKACLYQMKIGEKSLTKSSLEIPDNLEVQAMAVDETARLHLLLRSPSHDSDTGSSIIRQFDENGEAVKDLDISKALKDRYVIWQAFFVDSEGRYYVKDMDYTMCIDKEGNVLWEINNRKLGISKSYASVCAKGVVYMIYQRDKSTYIAEVNPVTGEFEKEYFLKEIKQQDMILAMEQGTDSDLLIYGTASGIWAWNRDNNELEMRADYSESELSLNETIVGRRFLSDGRLLIIKNISEKDTLKGVTLQYIPAGK